MEKIKALMPMSAFSLLLIKGLVNGMSQIDVAALFVLASLYGFMEIGIEKTKIKQLEQNIKDMNDRISSNDKRIDEVRTHVGAMKFGNQQRQQQNR